MQKLRARVWDSVLALVLAVGLAGCGGGGDGGGTPAADLNATGFWENPLNGATAAGNMTQTGGNVTAYLLLPPMGMGNLIGTVNGYHMDFTMAWDSGSSESGTGNFVFVNNSVDKLVFQGNLPSVGDFEISWRGPSFEEHDPAGVPLSFTPAAPTW